MTKKKSVKTLFIFRNDLIENTENYGISDLKNIRTTLRHYELQSIIPKPFKFGFGRGRGVTSVYLYEIVDILRNIIRLKKRGLHLHEIGSKIKTEYWEYHYLSDMLYLDSNLHHFGASIVSYYVDNIKIEGNLENFVIWLKSLIHITCERFLLKVNSEEVLEYQTLDFIAYQLLKLLPIISGNIIDNGGTESETFDDKTVKLMEKYFEHGGG